MSISDKLTTIAENVPKVYEAGQKAAEDAYWDAFTNSGSRKFYEYAFRGSGFEYIRPRHKIAPVNCRSIYMFCDCDNLKRIETAYFDLSGVTVGTSANTNGHYSTFYRCENLEEIEDIGLLAGGCYYTYYSCKKLHTIEVFRVTADCKFNSAFTNCNALQNITVDGTIGQNGLNFQWSPLTYDSLMSIVNALEDKTGDTSGTVWEVTFGDTNRATLGTSEKIATNKGWVIS